MAKEKGDILFVARDETRLASTSAALKFLDLGLRQHYFPAWDCLPYDRVSPNAEITSQRIEALTALLLGGGKQQIILTTVSALGQRVPPRKTFAGKTFEAKVGQSINLPKLIKVFEGNGYFRTETVMEPGEYTVRGGIVDVFPSGAEEPFRMDFFGNELESIRTFDPISQRTTGKIDKIAVKPVSEVFVDEESIAQFRSGYRSAFGNVGSDDPLYESISVGKRFVGMEHWLPLFYETTETLFDYAPEAIIMLDYQAQDAFDARLELAHEYFEARRTIKGKIGTSAPYNALEPDTLYLSRDEWDDRLKERGFGSFSPFTLPDSSEGSILNAEGKQGKDFADARANPNINVFDEVVAYIAELYSQGKKPLVTASGPGALDRIEKVLKEHGTLSLKPVTSWNEFKALAPKTVALTTLAIEHGIVAQDFAVITEQDILGERMIRPAKRRMRAENFIAEASAINEGDLVVHVEHGIGRFLGLETLAIAAAPHDCLSILYAGDDKLFVPVENIEVLSRYGSDQGAAQLDKLGGVAWQARKSKLKDRIRIMAAELIKVAAARELRKGEVLAPAEGLYDEFCARFPYVETDGQARAIGDMLEDMTSGKPMDRLVCGDVGFGKTEVALRGAFVTAMNGKQVAIVVPTTLLCRQHYMNFIERFRDYPIRVEQLSRMVNPKDAKGIKEGIKDGTVDIVIGTHTLLAKGMAFDRLGLLIIDEEQHFGVAHKEKLKQLKNDVHVLTLTATPIPRTLQMALSGVKELSIIASPPVDRLAVRTFVHPYDAVVIREAIMRERFRGGQTFYVCPRISDIDKVAGELHDLVPDIKVAVAHGRMPVAELEEVMAAFSEQAFDLLLCTNIIESGIDVPSANTLIVHRSDMFGLSQLYQIRGRVGRSKVRAFAYLTLPTRQKISKTAEKRLQVMQTLDMLGAGFSLASHDLDIRGAGNLLGDEQSGHIREVGIEFYQQMLEEAVAEAKGQGFDETEGDTWSPQINIGMPVLIPDDYVPDLGVRLSLYRRLADIVEAVDIDSFAAELGDRFGKVPDEVETLLQVMVIKMHCRQAGIEKIDAGPKGAVIAFRHNEFANPGGLIEFITSQSGTAKVKPDHRLVLLRNWERPEDRLRGVTNLSHKLSDLCC
ncbi:MAG: transcription-repair coupling factor [Rhodospirillales bacterium]|nr:transcription-repair coupling factor [Rhodospirillales bacterium]